MPSTMDQTSVFKALPGYPFLDPCPRCGYRHSCDCTVRERAQAAYPALILPDQTAAKGASS